jgi:POT family proton-dependent oligopeptide transporter
VNLFGNTLAGYIGAFTENMGQYPWMVSLAGDLDVRPEHACLLGVFGGLAAVLLLFSIALWSISGRVVVWMHGAEKTTK